MLSFMKLQKFLDLAKSHSRIAVFKEIPGDRLTPVNIYYALAEDYKSISMLESCSNSSLDKCSYLCLAPYAEFIANSSEKTERVDVFAGLEEALLAYRFYMENPHGLSVCSAIGFMSYDAIRLFENIPDSHKNIINIPDLFFRFYRISIAFIHDVGKVVISVVTEVGGDPRQDYQKSMQLIEDIIGKLHRNHINKIKSRAKGGYSSGVSVDVNDAEYIAKVAKAKQHIVDGDAFQIVLSRTFTKNFTASPFDIYRALRITNPSPYMFYLEYDDFVVVGASPEKLISIKNRSVETNPIAGTRPRGHDEGEDVRLAQELLQDEKEIAEHMMLVDLGRNDLGAVCIPESVKVTKLKEIQKFSSVMHLTSVVVGELAKNKSIIDALCSVFPAGTLTGAPKIRAMEIIDELEVSKRGLYGGAICVVDNQNNLDACIAIRMAILKDQVAYVRAGAGVVFDSNPESESEETKHKANAILTAIDLAAEGLLCF